jgi:hypothetical protein
MNDSLFRTSNLPFGNPIQPEHGTAADASRTPSQDDIWDVFDDGELAEPEYGDFWIEPDDEDI